MYEKRNKKTFPPVECGSTSLLTSGARLKSTGAILISEYHILFILCFFLLLFFILSFVELIKKRGTTSFDQAVIEFLIWLERFLSCRPIQLKQVFKEQSIVLFYINFIFLKHLLCIFYGKIWQI